MKSYILAFPNLQTSKIWLMSCEGLCGELLPNHLHSPWRIHLLQPLRSESITKLRKDQHKYANCRNSDSEFLYFSAIHSVVIQRKVHILHNSVNCKLINSELTRKTELPVLPRLINLSELHRHNVDPHSFPN